MKNDSFEPQQLGAHMGAALEGIKAQGNAVQVVVGDLVFVSEPMSWQFESGPSTSSIMAPWAAPRKPPIPRAERAARFPELFRLAANLKRYLIDLGSNNGWADTKYTKKTEEKVADVESPSCNSLVVKETTVQFVDLDDSWVKEHEVIDGDPKLENASLISSEVHPKHNLPGLHKIVIDLDMDAALIPSSTRGHYHLFIDKYYSWDEYKELLTVLAKFGIIQEGYAQASIKRGGSYVRAPWYMKGMKIDEI